jgi:hypothetical protein
VTADPGLDTNRTPAARGAPGRPRHTQRARSGVRWVGANPEPTPWTDAPPTANPTTGGR